MAQIHPRHQTHTDSFKSKWNSGFLQICLTKMQKWDDLIADVSAFPQAHNSEDSLLKMRQNLVLQMSLAVKHILASRILFKESIPEEFIYWFLSFEKRGLSVLNSWLLYQHSNLSNLILAEGYR
jgi:hypothetical protein